ncbi:MAG: hypothetical protein J5U19_08995 [Candidatus Methanoperedens sp.]|nr:hypothetical protein [Candidatus Methanoperedens sp.]
MSGDFIEIKEGDESGVFRVTKATPELIELTNEKRIDLKPGSRVELFSHSCYDYSFCDYSSNGQARKDCRVRGSSGDDDNFDSI